MARQPDKTRDLQHDRPSVTNRAWGVSHDPGDQSFGFEGQGGYGDFRRQAPGGSATDDAPVSDHRTAAADDDPRRRPDERVRAVVADELAAHETLEANQVLVAAEDGVVTLTGEVREAWMRDCAAEVASTVTGVRQVRNLVTCDDGSASFGPPGQAVRSEGAPRR